MHLLTRRIPQAGKDGEIHFHVTTEEDIWHLYNLIQVGDSVRGSAFRKIAGQGTRATSNRIPMRLEIDVTEVQWTAEPCSLRVMGLVTSHNEHVHRGQHHTFEIAVDSKLHLYKKVWEAQDTQRLQMATDPTSGATLAAIVIEPGLAHVCIVTNQMTTVKAKVELSIPKKRPSGPSGHDGALARFFARVAEAVHTHVAFTDLRAVLIAGPGFVPRDFQTVLLATAEERGWKDITEHKAKIALAHAASGQKYALTQVLQTQEVRSIVSNTGAATETRALEEFFEMLNTDPDRAFYGFDHVERCVRAGGVSTLLLTDSLFKSNVLADRIKYTAIVNSCQASAKVFTFSAANVTGEQLEMLTGIACLCKFAMPHIDDDDFDTMYGPQIIGAPVTAKDAPEDGDAVGRQRNRGSGDEEEEEDDDVGLDGNRRHGKHHASDYAEEPEGQDVQKDKKDKKDKKEKKDKKQHRE